jgi:hypothetical protein
MKTKWLIFLACFGMILWLTACIEPQGGGTQSPPADPECPADFMVTPSLVSPSAGSIISSLTPMFEWAYPGYYIDTGGQVEEHVGCYTPGFHLYLSSGPFFQDELGTLIDGVPAIDSLYTKIWTPDTPLETGTEYHWSIRPFSHGQEGPSSEVRTFFTGPACESDSLVAPIPVAPLNHWIVDDLNDLVLTWYYPGGCLPDEYLVEMSPIMLFDGSPLNGTTGTPTTHWAPTGDLQDCARYFWRVTALKDGQESQGSQVYTFRVDLTGTCPAESSGMIRGTVWEDQCAKTEEGPPTPVNPPLGCVYPTPGTIFTNQTYDPGEPGIPGLIVSLGQGACPSSGLRDVPTWGDGMYDFYMLSPGTYCVSVDSQNPYSSTVLLPGQWTYPGDAVGNTLASQTITVAAGQDVSGVDFGWWYEFGTDWGTTNAAVFGNVWHDLCAYVPGDPIPDPLPEGCAFDQWNNVHADAVRQLDEPGIPGVVVDIGLGDCPSAGLGTAITDADGYYFFNGLNPGKYCLRIDPEDGGINQGILMPGSWTYIPSGHEGMTFRAITLLPNHTLSGQDFGWDYDNLPVSAQFTLAHNAYCRVGPDTRYPDLVTLLAGQTFPILGRDQDGLWYFIKWTETSNCWLAASSGTGTGDPSKYRVFFGPPLPVVVSCSDHTEPTSCNADPACTWTYYSVGPGTCNTK